MTQSALIVGAGGAVGEAAAQALAALGWRVTASMRTQRPDVAERLRRAGANVVSHDVEKEGCPAGDYDAAVFLTRLDLTLSALERAAGLSASRIVAFSSNNVAVHSEAAIYRRLAAAEGALRARCPGAAIVRPTMIYGDARLLMLTRLMRLARKWPVLPLPGSGRARVQPVFHEDLGQAAAGLATTDAPGVYAVGGPDVVTMRQFFEAAARAAGARCSVVAIPAPMLRLAAPALSLVGFSGDQVARTECERIAVTQTPLPADLAPRTGLAEGLARHAAALA